MEVKSSVRPLLWKHRCVYRGEGRPQVGMVSAAPASFPSVSGGPHAQQGLASRDLPCTGGVPPGHNFRKVLGRQGQPLTAQLLSCKGKTQATPDKPPDGAGPLASTGWKTGPQPEGTGHMQIPSDEVSASHSRKQTLFKVANRDSMTQMGANLTDVNSKKRMTK